jgi:hypothetical protein
MLIVGIRRIGLIPVPLFGMSPLIQNPGFAPVSKFPILLLKYIWKAVKGNQKLLCREIKKYLEKENTTYN